jgi:hypothetical protein
MKKVLLDTTLASFVHSERPELELYEDDLRGVRFSVRRRSRLPLLLEAFGIAHAAPKLARDLARRSYRRQCATGRCRRCDEAKARSKKRGGA